MHFNTAQQPWDHPSHWPDSDFPSALGKKNIHTFGLAWITQLFVAYRFFTLKLQSIYHTLWSSLLLLCSPFQNKEGDISENIHPHTTSSRISRWGHEQLFVFAKTKKSLVELEIKSSSHSLDQKNLMADPNILTPCALAITDSLGMWLFPTIQTKSLAGKVKN